MRLSSIKSWVASLCVLALVACGGGGGGAGGSAGDPVLGTNTVVPAASSLALTLSAPSIANNGTQTVVATAVALDARNNTVAGVPVTLSADSGVVTVLDATTNAEGVLSATVGIGANQATRDITITASSRGVTPQVKTLQVVNSVGGTSVELSDLLLTLSSPSITSDGTQTVTVRATALDIKRNVLPGVAVSFSVDQGGTVQPADTVTGPNGVLSAVVGVGSLGTVRTMTITAVASGIAARTIALPVVLNPAPAQPVAADISLVLSASRIDNSGVGSVLATVTAVDANRNTLTGIPVAFSVNPDSNAIITANRVTTNASGVATANVSIGADFTNRVISVTASSGQLTSSKSLVVDGAKLTAALSPVVNAGSTNNVVEYKLVDVNTRPMAFQPISVSSPGLPTSNGQTDSNGNFRFVYTAPGAAGLLSLSANSAGASLSSAVDVVASGGVPNASLQPQGASLSPSPSVVSVNAIGSNTNQVQLRALFVGANNQPVPNIRVRFDLNGNGSSTDGVVSHAAPFAYSDASGTARGTFTAGQISSPTDGVIVRACWDLVDFAAGQCPNVILTRLTVANEALSVAIRTDNTVGDGTAGLTYRKRFVVMVVDASGQAKAGVPITPSVDLPAYYKGQFAWNGTVWVPVPSLASSESYRYDSVGQAWLNQGPTARPSCPNEDVNRNGVREAPAYVASQLAPALGGRQEDLNWNGDLDPRKADVAITMIGGSSTDANGLAIVQIEYGKNLASWVDFVITVTASGVSGSEAQAKYSGLLYGVGNLPYPARDVTSETVPPPFVVSPYGRSSVCTDDN